MSLVLFSGVTALILEGSLIHYPVKFLLALVALYFTGGSANGLNQYFEREIDARMSRTRWKRPLPLQKLTAAQALIFSISIGLIGILTFGFVFNWLTAILSLGTLIFYGFFYTLWLKPNTHLNIVIGGIAGAMAPVGLWAAASGSLAWTPMILFLIIFFWTPPHFWALALYHKDDYRRAGLPMMPVVKGEEAAARQIFYYAIFLVGITALLLIVGAGLLYLSVALIIGAVFLHKAYMLLRQRTPEREMHLFRFSLVYMFVILSAIIIDKFV